MIAAGITFLLALVLLLFLFFCSLDFDREALAQSSIPELQDDEEIYLEPQIMELNTPGDEDVEDATDEPAPQPPGEPDPSIDEKMDRIEQSLEEPANQPVSNKSKLVSNNNNSDLKTSTPAVSKEEEKRISSMSGKFKTDNNGARNGKESLTSGIGGEGISASGNVKGRKMLDCPKWKLKLSQPATVKVSIVVEADGTVSSAKALSGGTPNLRAQCEKMAKGSLWTKAPGAAPASGVITFNIKP